MIQPDPALRTMLAEAEWAVRPGRFAYLTLPEDDGRPAEARILEDEGVTLVVRVPEGAGAPGTEDTFGWITLSVQTSLSALGITAAMSAALAEAGIPCNMLAGYHHDHLLVPSADVERAVVVLTTAWTVER